MSKFYLVIKSGSKVFAVAGTDSGTCLANAEGVFECSGLSDLVRAGRVVYAADVVKQKNYGGRFAAFRHVDMAGDRVSLIECRVFGLQYGFERAAGIWGDAVAAAAELDTTAVPPDETEFISRIIDVKKTLK